ncbi:MAG: PAS domain-containing sensor histidine kinase [Nitrospirae bacterium]|nr:PAS domain-containing sensor histidine kinase [Nitrospirota bacterium]
MLKKLINRLFGSRVRDVEDLMDPYTQYEAIFANLPVGLSYLTPDMRYIRINPYLEKKTGLKSDEVAGKFCYDVNGMHKDDPSRTGEERICDVCGVRTALQTGKPFKFVRRSRPDLVVENVGVPIKDKQGRVIGAVEIILDITERVNMEERLQEYANELEEKVEEKTRELRRSKRFLNNIIESTTDAIFTLDSDGRICYLNVSAEGVLGHTRDRLFGMRFADIASEADRDVVLTALKLAGEKGERFQNLKVSVVGAEGGTSHQMLSLSPVSDDDSNNRFVGICKDVTKEKKLETEKEEFITLLTHDLKTPLTSIMGYSALILNNDFGPVEGDMRTSMEAIQVNSQKLLSLVKNFLSADKLDKHLMSMTPKPVKIEPIILESLKYMDPLFKDKGLMAETRLSPNMPRVSVDKEHIERVICNLLSNSVKFTPPGGSITVNAYHSDDGYVVMEISDTGVGIPEEELPMLFDKYYQGNASSKTKGSGLGLYIAKTIIEAHEGNIMVSSVKGKGTTFTIHLPQVV